MEVKSLAFYDGGASEKRQTTAYDAATRCPFRVIRVVLHLGQPLPVRPYQRTSSDRLGMSQMCQDRKSILLFEYFISARG
jgi:hypothetical protein